MHSIVTLTRPRSRGGTLDRMGEGGGEGAVQCIQPTEQYVRGYATTVHEQSPFFRTHWEWDPHRPCGAVRSVVIA